MATALDALVPPGYHFTRELGTGAYGKVYLCKDTEGRTVAVKVATGQKARRRTRREGELLATLHHPNVLHHFATIDHADAVFIVTEFLSGGDLLHFMKSRQCRPLPDHLAKPFFGQLVSAVDFLHRAGIVHRDIKCENILLSADYRSIRLADFGFACPWRADQLLHESLGSLHYASPEMCANIPYLGPEADIWSMGVVLYAMLVGRLPFGGKTEDELSARIKEGTFHTPSAMPQVPVALLRWLLHTDAKKRIAMDELKQHAWLTAKGAEIPRSSSEPLPKASVLPPSLPLSHATPPQLRRAQPAQASASPRVSPPPESARIPRTPTVTPMPMLHHRRPSAIHEGSIPITNSELDQPNGSGLLRRLSRFLGVDGTRKFSFSRIMQKDKDKEREKDKEEKKDRDVPPSTSPE